MRSRRPAHLLAVALAALVALVPAAPAAADTLETPAPGARNLAAAGGWQAWAAPTVTGRWRLMLQAPDGSVSAPAIADFGAAPDPAIGSDRRAFDGRRLLVVYSRCAGDSALAGCDVFSFQLNGSAGEERVARLASETYSETAPALALGRFSFVRRGGGPRKGVYVWSVGSAARPVRISAVLARETATNGGRVAYAYNSSRGGGLVIRRPGVPGGVLQPAARQELVPSSLGLDRYRATWLVGARPLQTARFAGSGGPYPLRVLPADRALPPGTTSVVTSGNRITRALTSQGVTTLVPALRFG